MRRTILSLTVFAAAAIPACSGEAAAPACGSPVPTTEVELADFEFRPACVEASNGDTLTFTNVGDAPHTFTVRDSDVSVNLDAGESGEATLTELAAGTVYAVTCTYHPQMVGALKVV
jgi:plastocyanin